MFPFLLFSPSFDIDCNVVKLLLSQGLSVFVCGNEEIPPPVLLPVTCLCSDQSQRGSLFTLFLYSPLLAFSSVCGLNSVRRGLWERAQEFLRKVYRDIGQMITRSRTIGSIFSIDFNVSAQCQKTDHFLFFFLDKVLIVVKPMLVTGHLGVS